MTAFKHKKIFINILIYLLFFLAIIIAYYPSLNGGFVLDDFSNIIRNDDVKLKSFDVNSLSIVAKSGVASTLGRPISMLSFGVNYYFTQFNPFYFKATNLIIHILNAILLLLICSTIQKHWLSNDKKKGKIYGYFPIVISLAWAIHPINVSTVAYVVQRMTLLAGFFTLLGIYGYIIGRISFKNKSLGQLFSVLSMLICTGLGILSKENAILLPLFILLIDRFLIKEKNKFSEISIGVFILLPIIIISSYLIIYPDYLVQGYKMRDFMPHQRLLLESHIVIEYIYNIVVPHLDNLKFYRDAYDIHTSLFSNPLILSSVAFIVILLTLSVALVKKLPLISFGILWFFSGHILESTIIPLEFAFEHRNYLPSIGIILLVLSIIVTISNKIKLPWQKSTAFIVFILCLLTFFHCLDWSNPLLHAKSETIKSPRSLRANIELGRIYSEKFKNSKKQQHYLLALEAYKNVLASSNNNDCIPYVSIITLNAFNQEITNEHIYTEFLKCINQLQPSVNIPRNVHQLIKLKTISNYFIPLPILKQSVDTLEKNAYRNNNEYMSLVFTVKSTYLANIERDHEKAIVAAKQALEFMPNKYTYHENLLRLLIFTKKTTEAQKLYMTIKNKFPGQIDKVNIDHELLSKKSV